MTCTCTCYLYLWPVPVTCTCDLYLWPVPVTCYLYLSPVPVPVTCTCDLYLLPVTCVLDPPVSRANIPTPLLFVGHFFRRMTQKHTLYHVLHIQLFVYINNCCCLCLACLDFRESLCLFVWLSEKTDGSIGQRWRNAVGRRQRGLSNVRDTYQRQQTYLNCRKYCGNDCHYKHRLRIQRYGLILDIREDTNNIGNASSGILAVVNSLTCPNKHGVFGLSMLAHAPVVCERTLWKVRVDKTASLTGLKVLNVSHLSVIILSYLICPWSSYRTDVCVKVCV